MGCFACSEARIHSGRGQAVAVGFPGKRSRVSLEEFCRVAEDLNARKIVGRFSTFLEHVKPSAGGVRVTRFNALFHWAIPARP
jgi:hypothetical protein